MKIIRLKIPEIDGRLAENVVDTIGKIRRLDLKKKPCISETLDCAQSLMALQVKDLSPEVVTDTLNMICKYRADTASIKGYMAHQTA